MGDFHITWNSTTRTHEELALMKTNHLRIQYRFAKILGQKVHLQEVILNRL